MKEKIVLFHDYWYTKREQVKDKFPKFRSTCKKHGIEIEDVLFFPDDLLFPVLFIDSVLKKNPSSTGIGVGVNGYSMIYASKKLDKALISLNPHPTVNIDIAFDFMNYHLAGRPLQETNGIIRKYPHKHIVLFSDFAETADFRTAADGFKLEGYNRYDHFRCGYVEGKNIFIESGLDEDETLCKHFHLVLNSINTNKVA